MAPRRVTSGKPSDSERPKSRPATTPEARENQLIALAYDVAEQQMRDGTASSQVITSLLKLGSSREKLEQQRLAGEVSLTNAKIEMMASAQRIEELYGQALQAMKSYSGQSPLELVVDVDDY